MPAALLCRESSSAGLHKVAAAAQCPQPPRHSGLAVGHAVWAPQLAAVVSSAPLELADEDARSAARELSTKVRGAMIMSCQTARLRFVDASHKLVASEVFTYRRTIAR